MLTHTTNVPLGKLREFEYLTAEKAALYRGIMRVFIESKARFKLSLRPVQVASLLSPLSPGMDGVEIERALSQLCDWANLERQLDTADVSTVEEFLRPRYLYLITMRGEAAERAVRAFEEAVLQPGELQTTALHDIQEYLQSLLDLARSSEPDSITVSRTLDALRSAFEQLTTRAQSFISSLQHTTQLQGIDLHSFMDYKQKLIDYLKRFIGELTVVSAKIAGTIQKIDETGIGRVFEAAVEREFSNAINPPTQADRDEAVERWQARWRGLSEWFIGLPGEKSQADELRGHARSAIPALLRTVVMMHDRRVAQSDRSADLRTLARWFAQAEDDRAAHRLWHAAFGLTPARHLRVDEQTLDDRGQNPVSPSTSWFDAPPVHISPKLRRTGHQAHRGAPARVIDRSEERAKLTSIAAREARQLAAARASLANGRRLRLSEMDELEVNAFDLFLDLLGEALSRKIGPSDAVNATSVDGSLRITLEPTPDHAIAKLVTQSGDFSGRDHFISICDAFHLDDSIAGDSRDIVKGEETN